MKDKYTFKFDNKENKSAFIGCVYLHIKEQYQLTHNEDDLSVNIWCEFEVISKIMNYFITITHFI